MSAAMVYWRQERIAMMVCIVHKRANRVFSTKIVLARARLAKFPKQPVMMRKIMIAMEILIVWIATVIPKHAVRVKRVKAASAMLEDRCAALARRNASRRLHRGLSRSLCLPLPVQAGVAAVLIAPTPIIL